MISREITFEAPLDKDGKLSDGIRASGDIRNILSAIITYFKEINSEGHYERHGSSINLLDYDLVIKYGQFGTSAKKDNEFLGLIFDGGGHWYGDIDQYGNSRSRERVLTLDNKNGIKKILFDILGKDGIKDIWNDEQASTSFSAVLNVPVKWTEHENNPYGFKDQTVLMVKKLNSLAKYFKALA